MGSEDKNLLTSMSLSELDGSETLKKVIDVIEKKQHCFIVKGEEILAAIIPFEDYHNYEETVEDYELLTIAINRMNNTDLSKTVSYEEVIKELVISEKDLEDVEVDIE